MEALHFGLAPAPASQAGGSGSGSSSSSSPSPSPVVHNLLLKKKFCKICLLNLPGLVLFKEKYECFALLFQYQYFIERDRLVLFYIFVKIFVYFFSLNIRSELELEL